MTGKFENERADVLMQIANFRLDRWKNRREHEWRISAALWALLAAAIYKDIPFPLSWVIVVIVLHAIWAFLNWRSNQRDIEKAFKSVEDSERLLGQNPDPLPCSHKLYSIAIPFFQVLATFALAWAAHVVAGHGPTPC